MNSNAMSSVTLPHLLKSVTPADVIVDPFPHIVIEHAISDELARQLIAAYPSLETITKGKPLLSNKRFSLDANDTRKEKSINPLWRTLIEAHITQEFLSDVLKIFRTHILATYPDFEKRFGPLDTLVAGVRKTETENTDKLLLDAQICVNTPVTGTPTSVKIAHVDGLEELFAGLLYLRHPDDDSKGGDLEIFKFKSGKPVFQDRNWWIDYKYVEKVKTVPYGRGNLIFFLNSPQSLHGVTVREKTSSPRLFLNLVVETPAPLFDLSHLREGTLRRLWRKIRTRGS